MVLPSQLCLKLCINVKENQEEISKVYGSGNINQDSKNKESVWNESMYNSKNPLSMECWRKFSQNFT